jgi:hypothetical protein
VGTVSLSPLPVKVARSMLETLVRVLLGQRVEAARRGLYFCAQMLQRGG